MQTVIFHLDLDAFFVSVERILNPRLEGQPVVVGGDPHGRGVVTACSYETRVYGVHSGMPSRNAYRLCPQAVFVRGHFEEYVRYSHLVRDILTPYPPVIEQASVDEFYMDFTGCGKMYGHFPDLASRLQREIWDTLRLPCSIGIGGNKTVAKIASDFNKPKGITYIYPGMEKEFLAELPVETIPGVGKVMKRELNSKGFFRVKDIASASREYLSLAFGKPGIDLHEKANGYGTEYLTPERERKSISKEHTFGTDVTSKPELEALLFTLTGEVCHTMRTKGVMAMTITLKLRYADFITHIHSKTVAATDDDKTVYGIAQALFRQLYTRRVAVRLIGVGVHNFVPFARQDNLFDEEGNRRKSLLQAVNHIRGKYGYESILLGAGGY